MLRHFIYTESFALAIASAKHYYVVRLRRRVFGKLQLVPAETEDARTIDAKFVSTSIISRLLKFPPKTQNDPGLELQTRLLDVIACCKQLSC